MLANTVKNAGAPKRCIYDKLRRGWAEKFHTVENNEEIGSALVAHTDEHRDKNEASASCIVTYNLAGFYTSRAVKLCGLRMRLNSTSPRGSSSERELATKQIPEKWLQTVRTSRNPDGSRMFERKD